MKKIYVTPSDNLQNILDGLDGPATIYLQKGIYYTKVEIKKSGVVLRKGIQHIPHVYGMRFG